MRCLDGHFACYLYPYQGADLRQSTAVRAHFQVAVDPAEEDSKPEIA